MAKATDKAAKKKTTAKKPAKKRVTLPLPAGVPAKAKKPPKAVVLAESRHLGPLEVSVEGCDSGVLDRLWQTVESRRVAGDVEHSHSARLMARGTAKVAQKLGEEAVECVIEATLGHRKETILESADLLYHLLVVWVDAGIRPEEVWAELRRREGISGIVEKAARPKGIVRAAQTTKLP
ncbi:phosphoribosyl-ATP diphosphatase [Roseicella aquatilis]|uniref:Phosphoribosyl-ATP pyrophosphatase n=1 Tax=Roseicella aquatilis TaxID=2527868 RepID=A0A4R4DKA7_9PROT|nr:phosphoribosyl-ATP diphosphatase [Roseicella aquatilis]TCZ60846.1 phosphoribosyl-ATP diphosphatase [Roseicella aquatilis]